MNAQELRIGNIIDAYGEEYMVGNMIPFDLFDLDHYTPIPLTEEWQIKFNATEKKVPGCVSEWQLFIDNFELNWDSDSGLIIFLDNSNESMSLNHILYVHQFQNIYFDLQGSELIMKQSKNEEINVHPDIVEQANSGHFMAMDEVAEAERKAKL